MKRKAKSTLTPTLVAEQCEGININSPRLLQGQDLQGKFGTGQKKAKMMIQMAITPFLKETEKREEAFVPIDRDFNPQSSQSTTKKKRGRPRKYDVTQSLKKSSQNVEVLIGLEVQEDNLEEEKTDAITKKVYQKMTYKNRLAILNDFVKFKDRPLINGKSPSFEDFCHQKAIEFNGNWMTIKSLCKSFSKDNSILTQLQILCSNQKKGRETGHIIQRKVTLSYPEEIDFQLADWIYGCIEIGYILTRESIREKAKELIQEENGNFKGSGGWLDGFLHRHHFSLRTLNDKPPHELEALNSLATKLKNSAKELIKQFKIKESMIINMDESPYFWEYMPRKIIAPQLSKSAFGWKRGFHNYRSTLILAASAEGHFLRPGLVLKRKTRYSLKCEDDINLYLTQSENGWVTEEIVIDWLKNVLIPHIKEEHCLLIWDSYEAHKSTSVLNFLKNYPKIHIIIIVGGRTSKDQPLDISINKRFKLICKAESIKHTNSLLQLMKESNMIAERNSKVNENIVKGIFLLFFPNDTLVNDQVIIAQKDFDKKGKFKQVSIASLMSRICVEDVYRWLRKGYVEMKEKKDFIKNAFISSGFLNQSNNQPNGQQLQNNLIDKQDIKVENDVEPLEINEEDEDEKFIISAIQEFPEDFELSKEEPNLLAILNDGELLYFKFLINLN